MALANTIGVKNFLDKSALVMEERGLLAGAEPKLNVDDGELEGGEHCFLWEERKSNNYHLFNYNRRVKSRMMSSPSSPSALTATSGLVPLNQ
jgi:hypothetical protein